jgi:hypothetical protein
MSFVSQFKSAAGVMTKDLRHRKIIRTALHKLKTSSQVRRRENAGHW